MLLTTDDPDRALLPDQPPDAEQLVAFVELHVSVVEPSNATPGGEAEIWTIGAPPPAFTVTVTRSTVPPPAPLHESVNSVVCVKDGVACEPLVALEPDHPPEAVHDVAFVLLHESVDVWPEFTAVGFAEMDTVGAGAGFPPPCCACSPDPPPPPHAASVDTTAAAIAPRASRRSSDVNNFGKTTYQSEQRGNLHLVYMPVKRLTSHLYVPVGASNPIASQDQRVRAAF